MSTRTNINRKPRLGQQLVYLHCRSLFIGDFLRIRRLDAIQKFLEQRRNAIPVLFDGYALEKVCLIAQKLLIDGIFASEALARQRFPLLFDPARLMLSEKASSEKVSSETKGSRISTGTSWSVVAGAQKRLESPGSGVQSAGGDVSLFATGQHIARSSEARVQVPPSAPMYLPYATQHWILNNVQTALEGCCFDFARDMLPEIIRSQELEVPEQLELTQWVSLLMQSASQLPRTVPAMGWEGFLAAAERLQSTIARRTRTSVNGMISLLDDAIIMTQSFKDVWRTAWCQDVRKKLQSSLANIEGLERNLRKTVSIQLQDIASKRAELDSMETKAIAHMVEVEKQHRVYVCEAMKQALLDLKVPGEKPLLINAGSESVKFQEGGEAHLKENLVNGRISDASAHETSPRKTALRRSEVQLIKPDTGNLNQSGLTSKSSWEAKQYPYSTPLESSNLFSPRPTQLKEEISKPQPFSKQLAAKMMTAGLLTGDPSALSQKVDLNANVKSEAKTGGDRNLLAKPYAVLQPFGSHESHKENSGVWDRARFVDIR